MTRLAKKILIAVVAAVLITVGLIGFAIHQYWAAVRAGAEAATQQNLKTIAAIEIQYFNTHSRTFGTFDQMVKEGMLTNRFSGETPVIDDYIFTLKVTPKTTNQASLYRLNADKTGIWPGAGRHFYLDSTGPTIHVNPDRPAAPSDPPLGE